MTLSHPAVRGRKYRDRRDAFWTSLCNSTSSLSRACLVRYAVSARRRSTVRLEMEDEGSLPLLSKSRPTVVDSILASQVVRKLDRRFLPLLALIILIACVNRSSVGFAAQDLCTEFHLTNAEYGRGVSLHYAGYLSTQVIGNAMLRRFGAPNWFAFLAFTWGCVALSMGFIQTATQFYVLQTLLGAAQGGAFPAVWYTISVFYPEDHVTRAYGAVTAAMYLSIPVSSLLSAGLLSLGAYVGVERWRLLFVVGGLVPIFFSLVLYCLLPASPEAAPFLEAKEKEWIAQECDKESDAHGISFWNEAKSVFANRTWRICTICAAIDYAFSSAVVFWAMLLVHDMLYGEDEDREDKEGCGSHEGNEIVSVLMTAVPYLIAGTACLMGRRCEIRNRSLFASIFYSIVGITLLAWASTPSSYPVARFLLLICVFTVEGLTFSHITGLAITSNDVTVRSTASSLYNLLSFLGAVVSPIVFGKLVDVTGAEVAMSVSGGGYFLAALLVFSVRDPLVEEPTKENAAESSPVYES